VPVNHRGERLLGPQALPLERRPPVVEEATRPAFPAVVPELPERLFEEVLSSMRQFLTLTARTRRDGGWL
jgi:hypothetical protein